jgi:pimeloyl-[acyl-carrier protein] methyl ester esterase
MTLHVRSQGAGRDLFLVHGWGLSGRVWREAVPDLAARFRVHSVDLPGYGGSRQVATDFHEAVRLLGEALPEDAIVCGWSLGGLLALALAHGQPGRVRALALVGATPCFVARAGWEPAMNATAFESFAAGLATDPGGTLATFVRLAALNGARHREAIRALSSTLRDEGLPAGEALHASLGWLRDIDLRPQVPQLRLPVTVIHGESDGVTPAAAGRWLASHIPGARFIGVPACAHVPFISHRGDFVAALESLDG